MVGRGRAGGAALAALVAIAGGACRRAPTSGAPTSPPPRPALGEVSVADTTAADEGSLPLDEAALTAGLRARLAATGLFDAAAVDAGGAATRVRARIVTEGAEVGDKGVARARVHLWLETRPSGAPGAISEQLDGAGELPYDVAPVAKGKRAGAARADGGESRRARTEALVLRVAGDLLNELAGRRRLSIASPEELRAAVRDGGELRPAAIRAIGERRVAGAADVLLPLLDDPDEELRDTALGALISLGDRRAVAVLTRSRSLRDRREMRKAIEAISRLGGEEADEYLSFVASSHDDDEIRAEAAAARERMQRRAADAGAP